MNELKLLLNAAQHSNDVKLREYIQSTEELARSNGTLNEGLLNWLEWARKKVDWYDPHIEAYDELLPLG